MFIRIRTIARINTYMIYASSSITLQPEQTDNLVLSCANAKLAQFCAPLIIHGAKKVIADYMY